MGAVLANLFLSRAAKLTTLVFDEFSFPKMRPFVYIGNIDFYLAAGFDC